MRQSVLVQVGQTEVLPGVIDNLVLAGGRAYAGAGIGGLCIIDVSNPEKPVLVSVYGTGGFVSDVEIVGNTAYVVSSPLWDGSQWTGSSLQVVDVSGPAQPRLITTYDTPGWEMAVAVMGTYAFVADGESGLRVLDVSDPTKLEEVSIFSVPSAAIDVDTEGTYVYVADLVTGLHVLDVTNPAAPREAGTLNQVAVCAG